MRAFLLVLAACSSHATENGRVVLDRKDGIVVVHDTTHVLELPLAKSSRGLDLQAMDTTADFPGWVGLDDPKDGRAFVVWITRLGAKRPANIQRWFDDKVGMLRRDSTIVADHADKFGDYPARVVDYVHHGKGDQTYQRFIGIDLEGPDLELVLLAVVHAPTHEGEEHGAVTAATPAQQAWLDDVLADARELRVTAAGSAR
jgi:hypothetical protein